MKSESSSKPGDDAGEGAGGGAGVEAEREAGEVDVRMVTRLWFPLALSWLLMGAELPLISAVMARLQDPEIHLAAYGGVVFPVALIIESPIIMLLAASTALSRNWLSYCRLRRFMVFSGLALTVLHVGVAFTPLYDVVARDWIGAPEEILEPARLGLMLMTPWTWAIACRRFQQGVLIRFGRSDAIGIGTAVRLAANAAVLGIGYWVGDIAGIVVATVAVSVGVLLEAGYVWWRVQPMLVRLRDRNGEEAPFGWGVFARFYPPLALTSLFSLLVQPLVTGSISRMPDALASLAVWTPLNGLVFMLKSVALAYNEVVVALLDRRGAYQALKQFSHRFALILLLLMVLGAASPLGSLWFAGVAGLPAPLAAWASGALWVAVLMPSLNVYISWWQGILTEGRKTRPITEAVILYLAVCALCLGAAVWWGKVSGLYAGLAALTLGTCVQAGWNWWRSRDVSARAKEESLG